MIAKQEARINFNVSPTAINLAKDKHWLSVPKDKRSAFSTANIKTMYHNFTA